MVSKHLIVNRSVAKLYSFYFLFGEENNMSQLTLCAVLLLVVHSAIAATLDPVSLYLGVEK